MKNKVCSLCVALVLVLSLFLPIVSAEKAYIYDELDQFYDYEETDLAALCADIETKYGIGVFYATVESDLNAFDPTRVVGNTADYILFIENEEKWNVFYNGKAEDIITDDVFESLWDVYNEEISLKAAATQCITAAEKLIADYVKPDSTETDPVITGDADPQTQPQTQGILRLVDDADVLTPTEEESLLGKLDAASEKYKVDFVVLTLETLDGGTVEGVAGTLYDAAGYGYGESKDGVLLLLAMKERKWHILTNGFAHEAITDSEAESIGEKFTSYLTEGEYAKGFGIFLEKCEYQIDGEINGFPFPLKKNLLISLGIGFVLAFIVTGIWKGQLKSVRNQENATVYTKQDSMNIAVANDFYLYSTVSRTAKPQSNSSSSSSSGGSSRGGASGSF